MDRDTPTGQSQSCAHYRYLSPSPTSPTSPQGSFRLSRLPRYTNYVGLSAKPTRNIYPSLLRRTYRGIGLVLMLSQGDARLWQTPGLEASADGVGQGQGGNRMKVSRSTQILAVCLGLWIGLVLVLASSLGWQIALPVLLLGMGSALVFASFLSFKS